MEKNTHRPPPTEDEELVVLYLLTGLSYLFGIGCIVFAFFFGVLEGEAMAWWPIIFGAVWIATTYQFYRLNRDMIL